MAWTTPATWTNGAVTAAQMNTEVRDHDTWLKGFADLITNSTAADTGTGTYVSITRPLTGDTAVQTKYGSSSGYSLAISGGGKIQWAPDNGTSDVTLSRATTGRLEVNGTNPQLGVVQGTGGTARNQVFGWISGDTQPRIALGLTAADKPRIAWGPGGSDAPDLFLIRDVAGRLLASGDTDGLGAARIGALLDGTDEAASHFAWRTGDDAPRISIGQDANGYAALRFGPGTGVVYETLYRESTANLVLTAHLRSEKSASASSYFSGNVTGDTGPRIRLSTTVSGRGSIYFDDGTAAAGSEDTSLYSSAAATLTCNGTFNTVTAYQVNDTQVVGSRKTGYTNAMTGTADRATSWATSTITLEQLAQRVKAVTDDLRTHGLIGT